MDLRPRFSRQLGAFFSTVGWVLGVAVVLAVIIGLVWRGQTGCEGDRDRAKSILEDAGYKKIEVGGAHARRCGEGDELSNTFTAIGPSGRYTEGVVCCSRDLGCGGKGCTIRFEP